MTNISNDIREIQRLIKDIKDDKAYLNKYANKYHKMKMKQKQVYDYIEYNIAPMETKLNVRLNQLLQKVQHNNQE